MCAFASSLVATPPDRRASATQARGSFTASILEDDSVIEVHDDWLQVGKQKFTATFTDSPTADTTFEKSFGRLRTYIYDEAGKLISTTPPVQH